MQPLWLPTHYELMLAFFKQSLNVKFWWAPKGARGRRERKIWMGTGGKGGRGNKQGGGEESGILGDKEHFMGVFFGNL